MGAVLDGGIKAKHQNPGRVVLNDEFQSPGPAVGVMAPLAMPMQAECLLGVVQAAPAFCRNGQLFNVVLPPVMIPCIDRIAKGGKLPRRIDRHNRQTRGPDQFAILPGQ